MEALQASNKPPSAGSRVLMTQLPDDESVRSLTQSDGRSDGGTTLRSHVMESPIPEEDEEDEGGRFSRKTDHSHYSRDQWDGGEDNVLQDGRDSRQSDVTTEQQYDAASDDYENGSEDDRSSPNSMSMDNVSDTYSDTYEPPELKDEDFDTDLEVDDDKWLHPEKYDRDTTGLTKYLNACEEYDVTPVRYFVKHMLETKMNLGHHGLGPAAMKALAVPLESNTSIELLDLEGNWIKEGVQHLCRVLHDNVYIVHLNLAENGLGNSGAECILDLLMENRTIEWLDLSGNNITDKCGEKLGLMLKRNTTLRHLKLRHNGLGNDSAQWLMEALIDGNDHLEILDISWNHFQTRGCVLLADALKENVGLKEVDVCMNGFGLDGAIALGEAIQQNRTLLQLDASYCRLPLEGAASLAYGLQLNEALESLNVGYNSLGPEGTLALLVGVERNECSSLTLLNFGNSTVTTQFQQLQDKLEAERPLRVLHGGVMLDTKWREPVLQVDPVEAFKRDPMTKLKEWVEQAGYRLIDLLRHFDKDNSLTLSREEFINGIKSINIEITDDQIDILLDRLDKDGDGEIDFRPWVDEGELIQGDNEHRSLKREMRQLEEERQRMLEEEPEPEPGKDVNAFLKQVAV